MFENIPSILMSTQPQWCEKIFEIIGENENKAPVYKKRIEVRKTRPKYPTPFKVYIYCTKGKFALLRKDNEYRHDHWKFAEFHKSCGNEILNGKVIAEFICDEITEMYVGKIGEKVKDGYICLDTTSDVLRSQACLTEKQLYEYCNGGKLYGWHISNLVIYDKPKELSEFYGKCNEGCEDCYLWQSVRVNSEEFDMDCASKYYGHIPLKRPPQSWCYVERVGEM